MLNGIKIIEIEGIGPGPFAGMMLADMGADVIVVQREKPPIPMMPKKDILNRGKRTLVLDLKSQDDIKKLKQLVRNADGLIEGFRPGVMERLGLGPEELCIENEKLPSVSLDDGFAVLNMIESVKKSHWLGEKVTLA